MMKPPVIVFFLGLTAVATAALGASPQVVSDHTGVSIGLIVIGSSATGVLIGVAWKWCKRIEALERAFIRLSKRFPGDDEIHLT